MGGACLGTGCLPHLLLFISLIIQFLHDLIIIIYLKGLISINYYLQHYAYDFKLLYYD